MAWSTTQSSQQGRGRQVNTDSLFDACQEFPQHVLLSEFTQQWPKRREGTGHARVPVPDPPGNALPCVTVAAPEMDVQVQSALIWPWNDHGAFAPQFYHGSVKQKNDKGLWKKVNPVKGKVRREARETQKAWEQWGAPGLGSATEPDPDWPHPTSPAQLSPPPRDSPSPARGLTPCSPVPVPVPPAGARARSAVPAVLGLAGPGRGRAALPCAASPCPGRGGRRGPLSLPGQPRAGAREGA